MQPTQVPLARPANTSPTLHTHHLQLDKDERRALLLSALLLPLRQLKYSVKGKEWPVSSFVVRDSLKW